VSAADEPVLPSGETLLLGGSWSGGGATYDRAYPGDLSIRTGTFAAAQASDVQDAYRFAAEAQIGWERTSAPARAEVLYEAADLLTERVDLAARRLTEDMGKAIRDSRAEVLRSAAILRYFAGELSQPSGETYPSADPSVSLFTFERALGVVCVITPWNFPFAIPTWKLAPAIGFGNAVVWKPAEAASGSAVLLARILEEAGLPAGVLNVVTGHGRQLSGPLLEDPELAAVTFTGSSGVGAQLRGALASRNVRTQLELGGKNPALVLADADLEDAALQVARGAMLASGQRCTATSRVYVERPVAARFRELLVGAVERLRVGDPLDEETDIGPLASVAQRETVARYLELAARESAEVLVGSLDAPAADSCFVAPTVITGVDRSSALVREEIFGPLLVLAEVGDFDEGLELANDTEFGLASSVFTRDLVRAIDFLRGAEAGILHVNRETAGVEPHVPFGGIKGSSSLSREQGKAAREFFTASRTAYLRTAGTAPRP
jgi:acyl-CoA reductase-like NAD-dependent aldehyde dehydrogenase